MFWVATDSVTATSSTFTCVRISHQSMAVSPHWLRRTLSWPNVPGSSGRIFKMARGISCKKTIHLRWLWNCSTHCSPAPASQSKWSGIMVHSLPQRNFSHLSKGMELGILHIPYNPAMNGLAKRFIQSLKQSLKAMGGEKVPLQEKIANFLLAYTNSEHAITGQSPATLFMGRSLRSRLDLLNPDVHRNVQTKQCKQNPKRSVLRTLQVG